MTLKKGDTLSFIVKRTTTDGTPIVGDAPKMKSQIRNRDDKLLSSFAITETVVEGEYLFVVPAVITKEWPTGTLYFDIEHKDNDIVTSTKTFEIQIEKDVTRDD